jgi:hypothetical protein
MQSAVVDARMLRPESERAMASAERAACVRNRSRGCDLRYTKSSVHLALISSKRGQVTRWPAISKKIQYTSSSTAMSGLKLRITAAV